MSALPTGLMQGLPGVYRLTEVPRDLPRQLRRARWTIGQLTGGTDRAAVLHNIGRALKFPDYYGKNLDALADCLSDLTKPTALIWQGWQGFAVDCASDWARVRYVFGERIREQPPFALVLT